MTTRRIVSETTSSEAMLTALVTTVSERPRTRRATSVVVVPPLKQTVSASPIRSAAASAIRRFSSTWRPPR